MACSLGATTAEAGAWNEEAGHGIVITDYTFSGGAKYFDGSGRLSRAAAYDKQEAIGYLEYGLTDDVTVIAKPSLSMIAAATSPDADAVTKHYVGLGTTEVGAQLHVMSTGPLVFAVQGDIRLPGTSSEHNTAVIGNTSRDLDLRGLMGLTFISRGLPAFIDVETGYRLRSSGASGEWHVDATLGVQPLPRWLVLLQTFNVISEGRGTAWFPASSYSKLGGAVVYDVTERWSVELGAFQTIFGDGALRERGGQVAVWYRF